MIKITDNPPRENPLRVVVRIFFLLFFLYFFLVSIELLGESFKMFGSGFAEKLLSVTANPFVGLFIGLLATSIVQSSSAVTSILVGMVAAGVMPLRLTIPIIMGSNVGTTVTNTFVSLAHITRPTEFRRAFAAATVHDFFNILSVVVFFPLELSTHCLEYASTFLASLFSGLGGFKVFSPLSIAVKPLVELIAGAIKALTPNCVFGGVVSLVVALALLFVSLTWLVKLMKKVVLGKIEKLLHGYLFAKPYRSFLLGLIFTCLVQSSSVVTSLIVPIVGAGILTIEQIYPYMLGSNIGTTITAILAALVTQSPIAIATAFVHTLYNVVGTIVFYWNPLRMVPIWLAKSIGDVAAKRRWVAIAFIVVVFYGIPFLLIYL